MKCARCGKSFRYTGKTVYCKDCWKDYKNGLDKKFAEIFPEVVETEQIIFKAIRQKEKINDK